MFVCGATPSSRPKLLAKDNLVQYRWCCDGAFRGAIACMCWEPVYDVEQADPDPAAKVRTRAAMCGDCAFKDDSPEMKSDPYALVDLDVFWCHRGMRRPKEWRHPDGRVRAAFPGDYQPAYIGDVPYRADGRPAEKCGGWAMTR